MHDGNGVQSTAAGQTRQRRRWPCVGAGRWSSSSPSPAGAADRGPPGGVDARSGCAGPGQAPDPCASPGPPPSVTGTGATGHVALADVRRRTRFDCFYVYPTVSTERSNNADLAVQPAERAVGGRPGVTLLPGVQRLGADVPAGHRACADPGRPSPARRSSNIAYASLLAGMEGLPRATTTTAGRSSSSGTRRARPCSSGFCRPRSTLCRGCAGRWSRPSSSGATCRCPRAERRRQLPEHPDVCLGCVRRAVSWPIRPSAQLRPPLALFGRPGQGVSIQSGQTTQTRSAGGLRQPGDLLSAGSGRCSPISSPLAPG